MKHLFLHAKSSLDIKPVLKKVKIDGKIGLVSNIQHLHKLPEAQKIIKNSVIAGQVIGCDASSAKRISSEVDCFLFIGTGRFHPMEIAVKTGKPVYLANPLTNEFSKLPEKDIEEFHKREKGALLKFHHSNNIGILVSMKEGQFSPKQYLNINQKLNGVDVLKKKYPEKEFFVFVFDTLNFSDLNHFTDIECWVNTSCPRIEEENIINIQKLL